MAADHLLLSRLRHHHRHRILHPLLDLPPHIAHLIPLHNRLHLHRLHRPHHPVLHLVTKIGEVKDSRALMEEVLVDVAVVEAIAEDLQVLMNLLNQLQLINNNQTNNNNGLLRKRTATKAVVHQTVRPAAAAAALACHQNNMSHGSHHTAALHHLLRLRPKIKRGCENYKSMMSLKS
jgi:hypothetical protein